MYTHSVIRCDEVRPRCKQDDQTALDHAELRGHDVIARMIEVCMQIVSVLLSSLLCLHSCIYTSWFLARRLMHLVSVNHSFSVLADMLEYIVSVAPLPADTPS